MLSFKKKKALLSLGVALCTLSFPLISEAGYEKNYIGEMGSYTAVYEDTLVHLARDHDLGFVEIRAANPDLDPWIPGEGAEVVLPKMHLLPDAPREGLVINLAEMRVYAYLNADEAPYTYPLGIGREGLDTPMGKTTVVRKKDGPSWHPTKRMRDEDPELPAVVGPGPENPLGTHAIYLGWPTYLMHGTNRPYGIGRRVSSGCIRMYPEDIKTFFDQVPVGTKVNVIHQPIKVGWIDNELYLEAHTTMDEAIKMEETGAVSDHKLSDEDMAVIVDRAGQYKDLLNWPRIREAVRLRAGYPVRIARYFEDDVLQDEVSSVDAGITVEGDAEVQEGDVKSSEKASEDQAQDEDKLSEGIEDDNIEGQEEGGVVIPSTKPVRESNSDQKKVASNESTQDTESDQLNQTEAEADN